MDELSPREREQDGRDVRSVFSVHEQLDMATIEAPPFDGRGFENATLGIAELVETRGEQSVDRRRHDQRIVRAKLGIECQELLEKQGIPVCRLEHPRELPGLETA